MRYAQPVSPGLSSSVPLLEGDAGIEQTINAARGLVREGLRDPLLRQTAGHILLQRRVPQHNDVAEVRAIYDWVVRNIRFVKDPVNQETVSTARWTLTNGFGDCDDINAVLLPVLLGAAGYRTRLVTVAGHPGAPRQFTHVYAEVLLRGRWIPVDAARPGARFGQTIRHQFRKRVWSLDDGSYTDMGLPRQASLAGETVAAGVSGLDDWADVIKQATRGTAQIITATKSKRRAVDFPSLTYGQPGVSTINDYVPLLVLGGLGLVVVMMMRGRRS